MLTQVYDTLKKDSRNGDFVALVESDKKALKVKISDEDITSVSQYSWKKCLMGEKYAAFVYLMQENSSKEKTKHIQFDHLQMSQCLFDNESRELTLTTFKIRFQAVNIK